MPAFNEEGGIQQAIEGVRRALSDLTLAFEIIVIDDGSTDTTGAILDRLANNQIHVIHFPQNEGYGRSLRAGFDRAIHPFVFFIDSDGQFDPYDLAKLLPFATQFDLIVGYRENRSDSRLRSISSRVYNSLIRMLLGIQVRDVNCAFKLIQRGVLKRFPLVSDSYTINAELLSRASRANLRVQEVAVTHHPRLIGTSKVGPSDIPRSLAEAITLRQQMKRE